MVFRQTLIKRYFSSRSGLELLGFYSCVDWPCSIEGTPHPPGIARTTKSAVRARACL